MLHVVYITENNYGLEITVKNSPGFLARLFGAKESIKAYRGFNDTWREIPSTINIVSPKIVRFLKDEHEAYHNRKRIAGI